MWSAFNLSSYHKLRRKEILLILTTITIKVISNMISDCLKVPGSIGIKLYGYWLILTYTRSLTHFFSLFKCLFRSLSKLGLSPISSLWLHNSIWVRSWDEYTACLIRQRKTENYEILRLNWERVSESIFLHNVSREINCQFVLMLIAEFEKMLMLCRSKQKVQNSKASLADPYTRSGVGQKVSSGQYLSMKSNVLVAWNVLC